MGKKEVKMEFSRKLSILLFIIGSLLSIFSASFPMSQQQTSMKFIFLIFLGVFIGILNILPGQEYRYLIATTAFVISAKYIMSILDEYIILSQIGVMINNLIVLFASAAIVVAIKEIIRFTSATEEISNENSAYKTVFDQQSTIEKIWDIIIIIAVSLAFISIISLAFFRVEEYVYYFNLADFFIMAVFIVDLFFLYDSEKGVGYFIRHNYMDIIAAIPMMPFLWVAKVFRATKIIKLFSTSAVISKMNRPAKFFSENASFNKYMGKPIEKGKKTKKEERRKDKPRQRNESARNKKGNKRGKSRK